MVKAIQTLTNSETPKVIELNNMEKLKKEKAGSYIEWTIYFVG